MYVLYMSSTPDLMTSDFSDELEALLSIFPNHIIVLEPSTGFSDQLYTTILYSHKELNSEENSTNVNLIWNMDSNYVLSLHIPCSYPIIDQRVDKITLSLSFTSPIDSEVRENIVHELYQVIDTNVGEVIIFPVIQRLIEMMDTYRELENRSGVRCTTSEVVDELEITSYDTGKINDNAVFTGFTDMLNTRSHLNIIHGPVTTEQKSSFQAHICCVSSMEEVAEFRRSVLSDKKVARATHNIFAYRFSCNPTG